MIVWLIVLALVGFVIYREVRRVLDRPAPLIEAIVDMPLEKEADVNEAFVAAMSAAAPARPPREPKNYEAHIIPQPGGTFRYRSFVYYNKKLVSDKYGMYADTKLGAQRQCREAIKLHREGPTITKMGL